MDPENVSAEERGSCKTNLVVDACEDETGDEWGLAPLLFMEKVIHFTWIVLWDLVL
jgi:hypothetical protein